MIIDDFYNDPQRVISIASQFTRIGCGVGVKSPLLQDIDLPLAKAQCSWGQSPQLH